MRSREELTGFLTTYQTKFQVEKEFIEKFLDLLQSPRAFHRDHLPGHITGSAWILNEEKSHALLIHHAKLDKWLQPDGHADGDENVLNVAVREVNEETGLTDLKPLISGIFDIDIHPIPARKDFPEHLHYDIRFAFIASKKDDLKISNESRDLQWVHLEEIPTRTHQNASILRMIQKSITK